MRNNLKNILLSILSLGILFLAILGVLTLSDLKPYCLFLFLTSLFIMMQTRTLNLFAKPFDTEKTGIALLGGVIGTLLLLRLGF